MSKWGRNSFWRDLMSRLKRQEEGVDFLGTRWDADSVAWVHDVSSSGEAPPAFLQGRRLVVDVSDRELSLYPLGMAGRFRLSPCFEYSNGRAAEVLRVIYGVGETHLVGTDWHAIVRVSQTLPALELELADGVQVAWVEADKRRHTLAKPAWLHPADFCLDPVIERNNSTIPDPPPLPSPRAGVLVTMAGDRLVIALGTTRVGAELANEQWEHVREDETGYWKRIGERLAIDIPNPEINRQARYSVHSSLFSRSVDDVGRDIFVHGRRDRGYADTAHLHQSYQMHLPALAAGEHRSVRDELHGFLGLQDANGWIERSPRPFAGSSTYVGRYTGVHLLLAAHRYLAWSGDTAFFNEMSISSLDPVERTVRDRIDRAAEDLIAHRYKGLIRPCGWADAWNPNVRAQGQISAAAVLALRSWATVVATLGHPALAERYAQAAADLSLAMREALLDPATGIVAEHVFDGRVEGGTPDDFWAHTQIWSALAGITHDGRGLDLVEEECLDHGVSIAPQSSFEQEYLASSTDSAAELPLESTATWLLASWPEVTHLYAMAELERERADAALAAVLGQLPETIHALEPTCAPWYYAEKYLFPGTRPWLCTWAGDPTLIEVVLCGFLGIRPGFDGLRISPRLPSAWIGGAGGAKFYWRDRSLTLQLAPDLESGTMQLGDRMCQFGDLLTAEDLRDCNLIRVSSAQSIADVASTYPDNS